MTYEIIPPDAGYAITPGAPPGSVRNVSPEEAMATWSIAQSLAHQAGLTGRWGVEMLFGLPELAGTGIGKVMHYVSGGLLPNPQPGAVDRLLTQMGFAEPQNWKERLVGDVTKAVGGTGAVIKGAQMVQNAPAALQTVANALQASPGSQAFGAAGAGLAGGGAREAGMPPWAQFLSSLVGGIAAPTAANASWEIAKGAGRLSQSLAQPFNVWKSGGPEAMAGNVVNQLATDPVAVNQFFGAQRPLSPEAAALRQQNGYAQPAPPQPQPIPTYIPGSVPTTAQAVADPGLLRLESGLRSGTDAPFAAQEIANNGARNAALRKIAGTPEDLAAMEKARSAQADIDYGNVKTLPVENVSGRQIKGVLDRPSVQLAWKRAEVSAADRGMKPSAMNTENPEFMHLVKLELDDIAGAIPDATSAGRTRAASVGGEGGARGAFLDLLDNISPYYGIARGNFAQASKPIEQSKTLLQIMKDTDLAQPDVKGNPTISQAKWGSNVTDNVSELAKILSPEQLGVLKNVGLDLDRAGLSTSSGVRPFGSPTYTNLASDAGLRAAVGAEHAAGPITQLLSLPIRKLFEYSGSNQAIRELLIEAMQKPDVMRRLLQASSEGAEPTLASLFGPRQEGILQGSALGGAIEAAGAP